MLMCVFYDDEMNVQMVYTSSLRIPNNDGHGISTKEREGGRERESEQSFKHIWQMSQVEETPIENKRRNSPRILVGFFGVDHAFCNAINQLFGEASFITWKCT